MRTPVRVALDLLMASPYLDYRSKDPTCSKATVSGPRAEGVHVGKGIIQPTALLELG